MNLTTATTGLSFRELALQAAAAAKLSRFSHAADANAAHDAKIQATFTKTCPPTTRFATHCDTGIVKQFAFISASSNKMAILSCPFPTQDKNNDEVFAGTLGDTMDFPCPVTIRMKDVRGEVVSICETRAEANAYNLPTSTSDPMTEEAPPSDDDDPDMVVINGPERIGIELNVPTKEPCFVAIPKVLPLGSGATAFTDFSGTTSIIETKVMPSIPPASFTAVWYEAMGYGVRKLNNKSIHGNDVLFRYAGLEKAQFQHAHRQYVTYFTVIVTYLTPDDALYHEVAKHVIEERDKLCMMYGAKIIAETPPAALVPPPAAPTTANPGAPGQAPSEIREYFEGLAKVLKDSSSTTLTAMDREKQSEAADATRFYGILFGTLRDVVGENGETTKMFVTAKIQPLFALSLEANTNSKAKIALHEALETKIAEISHEDNHFASASNLDPRMFDQPLTAVIRTGQWAHQHTAINPDDLDTKFGIHHLAPPRTWTSVYTLRMQGEVQLTQQEQVEEDTRRHNSKSTSLYHMGSMGSISDIHEMCGNMYVLICTIVEFDRANPPLIWSEILHYTKILRSADGKGFTSRHRNIKEVMFNIGQDIQSIITGFVSEARKTSYKAAVKAGTPISPLIFHTAQSQAAELRSRFTLTILGASAGVYKDVPAIYKLFQPESTKEEKDKKKREANNDGNSTPQAARNRPFTTGGNRQNSSSNYVTPNGSPSAPATSGKTVLVHAGATQPAKYPHPGAIFPHPTKPNTYTVLCCNSAYEGRRCSIPSCSFFHFPSQLSQVPREVKDKLKTWVGTQPLVTWHADAASWATPTGNVRPPAIRTPAAVAFVE